MGYRECLEKAGAFIYDYEEFGDYQGSWYAIVNYNGKVGLVGGSYGSCSSCDAFQREFDYPWNSENDETYDSRMIEFGQNYLSDVITFDEAIKNAKEASKWDLEAESMRSWLENNQLLIEQLQFNQKLDKTLSEE